MTTGAARILPLVAVPTLLALLSALQHLGKSAATEYLVLPPFAVIVYTVFRAPRGPAANMRSIIVLPCVGAVSGELCYRFFGLTPLGVAIATATVLAAQELLRASMPPALALAVLAMLLHATGPTYLLGVAEGTALIGVALLLWRGIVDVLASR
jgi:CBS-domain-containing membrane protein